MIVAKWREGYGFYKDVDAQLVAEEIMSIGDKPTSQEIVDAARNPNTELHKCFEWDNSIAAEKYRLVQARYVVHHLVIQEKEVPQDRPEIRVFFKTQDSDGYQPTSHIVRNEDSYKSLLARAWSELRAFKVKYAMLEELQEIFDLIQ